MSQRQVPVCVWSATIKGADAREYTFRVMSNRPTRLRYDGQGYEVSWISTDYVFEQGGIL